MPSSAARTTARAPAASTPRWRRATWVCALVIAKGFARIHRQNLVNFGVLPLVFADPSVYDRLESMDLIVISDLRKQIAEKEKVEVKFPKRI